MEGTLTLDERRAWIAAAREALRGLDAELWRAGGGDLGPLLGEVDALGAACDAGRVAVVREAMDRGETSGGSAAMTVTQWVRHHAPSTKAGGAGTVVAVAQAFQKQVNAPVKEAVDAGRLPVASAAAVVSEYDRLRPMLGDLMQEPAPDHADRPGRRRRAAGVPEGPPVHPGPVRAGGGPAGPAGPGQGVHLPLPAPGHRGGHLRVPAHPRRGGQGRPRGRARAAVRAETGRRGTRPRTSDRRRGDALLTLVRRAVAAGDEVGKTNKTTLLLTMDWESLRDGLGAADHPRRAGRRHPPGPETVRRLCCDGSVIPVVLGGDGEVLDWGLEKRFFTDAQTKRLWLRDGGCTYPGCDAHRSGPTRTTSSTGPTSGPSDLDNGALLCERHHTVVHSTPGVTPAASSATSTGRRGRVGPDPARLLRRTARPGVPPRNQRDPAPHPGAGAGAGGRRPAGRRPQPCAQAQR